MLLSLSAQTKVVEANDPIPVDFASGPFPFRLHEMLERVELEGLTHIVSWSKDAEDEFVVHDPKQFAAAVMPRFFNQTQYKSFQRQLNLYSFKRRSEGRVLGIYSHPLFRKSNRCLALKIQRAAQANRRSRCPRQVSQSSSVVSPPQNPPPSPLTASLWKTEDAGSPVPSALLSQAFEMVTRHADTLLLDSDKVKESRMIFSGCMPLEDIDEDDDLASIGTIEDLPPTLMSVNAHLSLAADLANLW